MPNLKSVDNGTQNAYKLSMYIYLMTDQLTNKCYLGCTINCDIRYRQFINDAPSKMTRAWVQFLRERGLLPKMTVLMECEPNQTTYYEQKLIDIYRNKWPLSCLNKAKAERHYNWFDKPRVISPDLSLVRR